MKNKISIKQNSAVSTNRVMTMLNEHCISIPVQTSAGQDEARAGPSTGGSSHSATSAHGKTSTEHTASLERQCKNKHQHYYCVQRHGLNAVLITDLFLQF